MSTKTTTKGTCGACFRSMALDAHGKVVRHGWKEDGGTRRVGSYGHVYHTGPCFGAGWLPYETSADCTRAFLAEVLYPMALRLAMHRAWLDTNPGHTYRGDNPYLRTHNRADPDPSWTGAWECMVRHGDPETACMYLSSYDGKLYPMNYGNVPSYAKFHATFVAETDSKIAGVKSDALFCIDKVEMWAPAAVVTATTRRGPLVHGAGRNDHFAACGRRVRSMYGVRIQMGAGDDVTCPKCLAALAKTADAS